MGIRAKPLPQCLQNNMISKLKSLSSWGNFPNAIARVGSYSNRSELFKLKGIFETYIARGNGRSYGDSSIGDSVVETLGHSLVRSFDANSGLIEVEAGILLEEILRVCIPRGWFLAVSPGTKMITVGGAIASDVHGKNHYIEGCFSESVVSFELADNDQESLICSKWQNAELFRMTCGGQGLTGVILSAKIQLKKIESRFIDQVCIKTKNLRETFEVFTQYKNSSYMVAWIDSTAEGSKMGRGHVTIGEFSQCQDLRYKPRRPLRWPQTMLTFDFHYLIYKSFNFFCYHRQYVGIKHSRVSIDRFFYPLDLIDQWNRMYGKSGFVQYQFVLPYDQSYEGIKRVLEVISQAKVGSFLSVLKRFGEENDSPLSFPLKGFTLAIDFKINDALFSLLSQLDAEVLKYGGRFYLAKDARMSKQSFEQGYPDVEEFRKYRQSNCLDLQYRSHQSVRLDI